MTDSKETDDRKRADTLAGAYCVVRGDDPSPETKDGLFARRTRLGLPPLGWTCFHCGETFTTIGSARDHFGCDQMDDPACRIKAGDERGLVMALRKAEAEIRRLCSDERDYQQYVESVRYILDGPVASEGPREPSEAMIEAAVRAGMIDLSKPGKMPTLREQAAAMIRAALATGAGHEA